MANRHLSRSVAMQSLFEWDFNNGEHINLAEVLPRNTAEFAPGLQDDNFAKNLVEGVIAEQARLDTIIEKAAPDWPMAQIAIVDRNILRLGLYELLFSKREEVPAKVAINEAIELAKTFGGENSGRFVNGVLGAVYKEMGEPGKDDAPKKKKPADVPYEEMPIDKLGGAVIYCREGEHLYIGLVHDVFGYWTLSKGRVESGEDVQAGTKRKIKEEVNLDLEIKADLGSNEYIASDPERGKVRKQVTYYLAEAKQRADMKLNPDKGGLDQAKWFTLGDIPDLRMYDDIVPLISQSVKILLPDHGQQS